MFGKWLKSLGLFWDKAAEIANVDWQPVILIKLFFFAIERSKKSLILNCAVGSNDVLLVSF